jgi:hypothetical protein
VASLESQQIEITTFEFDVVLDPNKQPAVAPVDARFAGGQYWFPSFTGFGDKYLPKIKHSQPLLDAAGRPREFDGVVLSAVLTPVARFADVQPFWSIRADVDPKNQRQIVLDAFGFLDPGKPGDQTVHYQLTVISRKAPK